jgi:hypothetical protein
MTVVPTTYHIPYSNRLIEFLTENAISNAEDIPNNIGRIQNRLSISHNESLRDVWSDELRFIVHHEYFKHTNKHYLHSSQLNRSYEPLTEVPYDEYVVYNTPPEFRYNSTGDSLEDSYYEYDKNAGVFKVLKSQPNNWNTHYWTYYRYSNTEGFKPLKSTSNISDNIAGFKNCKQKKTFEQSWDITGYIDKDVENKLFGYRSV